MRLRASMLTMQHHVHAIAKDKEISANAMIRLGAEIMQRAAERRMTLVEVAEVYDLKAPATGSRKVQISKLRVFWRFGHHFGLAGPRWLRARIIGRQKPLSTYESLIAEMRKHLP
jgi:hypothetical protein